jgi:hypothetical protein
MTLEELNENEHTDQSAHIEEIVGVVEMMVITAQVPSVAITQAQSDPAAAQALIEYLIQG